MINGNLRVKIGSKIKISGSSNHTAVIPILVKRSDKRIRIEHARLTNQNKGAIYDRCVITECAFTSA